MDLAVDLANALWTAAHANGHNGLEFEFRIGHMLPGGTFSSNVGKDNFARLQKRLNECPKFERVVDVETIETIGPSMKHVTTVSIADPAPMPIRPPYCMTKSKLFQKDYHAAQFTVRCGIALEKNVPLRVVHSRLTRRKKRRRYVYRCWAFDLTEVVSNTDVDTEETYEVELELLDTGMMFERTMDSLAEWGLLLVRDMIQMLSNEYKD